MLYPPLGVSKCYHSRVFSFLHVWLKNAPNLQMFYNCLFLCNFIYFYVFIFIYKYLYLFICSYSIP